MQSWLYPAVQIGDEVVPLNRTPKIMGSTLDTHFAFGPHAWNYGERALGALNVMAHGSLSRVELFFFRLKLLWPRIRSLSAPS